MWQFNHCPHCGNPIDPAPSSLGDQLRSDSLQSIDCVHCGEPIDLKAFLIEEPLVEENEIQISDADFVDATEDAEGIDDPEYVAPGLVDTAIAEEGTHIESSHESGLDEMAESDDSEENHFIEEHEKALGAELLESEQIEEESCVSDEIASEGGPAIVFSLDEEPMNLELESEEHSSMDIKEETSLDLENQDESAYATPLHSLNDTLDDSAENSVPSQQGLELNDEGFVGSGDDNVGKTTRFVEPKYADEEALVYEQSYAEDALKFTAPDDGETLNPFATSAEGDETNWQILQSATRRPRRPEPSAFRKIVPPILGGLAAFPIATAIMWYGFGKDIGTTGQVVAEYVPWIVPSKFHKNRWEASIPANPNKSSNDNPSKRGALPKIDPNINIPNRKSEKQNDLLEPLTPSNGQNPNDEKTPTEVNMDNDESRAKPSAVAESTKPIANPEPIPEPIQQETSTEVASVPMSVLVADMRKMQDAFFTVPKEERLALVKSYYQTAQKLSEESSKLKGRTTPVSRSKLELLAKEILAVEGYRKTFERCASGKIVGIPAAQPNEFVATAFEINENNKPQDSESWMLNEKWSLGKKEISVEVLPGALKTSTNLPATVLVFGKIVQDESTSELKLQIHLALPIN